MSAVLTWNHSNSRAEDFSYMISITTSCPNINTTYTVDKTTTYTFNDLCSNDNYTVVVLAEDKQVEKRSRYSNPIQFMTKAEIPSPPRFIVLSSTLSKHAMVTWHPPRDFNLKIFHYEVKLVKTTCEANTMYQATVEADKYSYEFNDFNEEVNAYIACVCVNSTNKGEWGVNMVTPQGLTNLPEDNCSTLIIVCVFAGLAIIACIFMVILLLFSLYQCNHSSVESKT